MQVPLAPDQLALTRALPAPERAKKDGRGACSSLEQAPGYSQGPPERRLPSYTCRSPASPMRPQARVAPFLHFLFSMARFGCPPARPAVERPELASQKPMLLNERFPFPAPRPVRPRRQAPACPQGPTPTRAGKAQGIVFHASKRASALSMSSASLSGDSAARPTQRAAVLVATMRFVTRCFLSLRYESVKEGRLPFAPPGTDARGGRSGHSANLVASS